jgi:chromosome segregation ATPase
MGDKEESHRHSGDTTPRDLRSKVDIAAVQAQISRITDERSVCTKAIAEVNSKMDVMSQSLTDIKNQRESLRQELENLKTKEHTEENGRFKMALFEKFISLSDVFDSLRTQKDNLQRQLMGLTFKEKELIVSLTELKSCLEKTPQKSHTYVRIIV